MLTGMGGILVMGVGILFSGLYIRRREPSPQQVAAWVGFCALTYTLGTLTLSQLGCSSTSDYVLKDYNNETNFHNPSCINDNCMNCDSDYAPVCGGGKIYFSPCHAGCDLNLNCTCVLEKIETGLCDLDCPNFKFYVFIFMFIVFVHSTSEVGSMLLTLRCVQKNEKSMALGLIQCAIGVLGNVPCPVIYGAIIDSTCVLWGGGGGDCDQGNCWLYDSYLFRVYFHGLASFFMFIAFLFDILVYFKAKDIQFVSEPSGGANVVAVEMD